MGCLRVWVLFEGLGFCLRVWVFVEGLGCNQGSGFSVLGAWGFSFGIGFLVFCGFRG